MGLLDAVDKGGPLVREEGRPVEEGWGLGRVESCWEEDVLEEGFWGMEGWTPSIASQCA